MHYYQNPPNRWNLRYSPPAGPIQAHAHLGPLYFLPNSKSIKKCTIAQIMGRFLRSGAGKRVRIIWLPRLRWVGSRRRSLGLGSLVIKNISLVAKWMWQFPLELHSPWHRIIRNKFGANQIGWDVSISFLSHVLAHESLYVASTICFIPTFAM